MPAQGSTSARGYGHQHQQLRAQLLPQAWGQRCPRCGRVMLEGQALDLDHTDDRSGYRGMAHRKCNRAAGARKTNRIRRAKTTASTPQAGRW